MKLDNLFFYYGLEIPNLDWCHAQTNTAIILQEYHPLIQQGVFEEYFPNSERYLYWNCTKLHKNECTLPPEEMKYTKFQPEWDCYILDLSRPTHRAIIIKKAIRAMQNFGVTGLFVDDLDVWVNNCFDQKIFLNFFEELRNKLPKNTKYIFNRGFPFWSKLTDCLASVVIEDVGPEIFTGESQDEWLKTVLKIHTPIVLNKRPELSIFFMQYKNGGQHEKIMHNSTFNNILTQFFDIKDHKQNFKLLTQMTRQLNRWPNHMETQKTLESYLN